MNVCDFLNVWKDKVQIVHVYWLYCHLQILYLFFAVLFDIDFFVNFCRKNVRLFSFYKVLQINDDINMNIIVFSV